MSKQKTPKSSSSKSSSSSKLTKAELEAVALDFREEMKKVLQIQQGLQESTTQEFETLRAGLQRLEQILSDFDSRSNINEKQLQTVGEMAALAQQRVDKELAVLSERPWEKISNELRLLQQSGTQGMVDLEQGVRREIADLSTTVEQAIQRISGLENRFAEQAATLPVDREQDILALDRRLSVLEADVELREVRLAALEQAQSSLTCACQELRDGLRMPAQTSNLAPGSDNTSSAAHLKERADCGAMAVVNTGKSVQAWLRQARLLWNGQRYADPQAALDCLSSALEIEPENSELLNERGLAWADAGFPEKAIADFSRAILLDASLAQAFHNRGLMHMKVGNRDLACRDFRSAAALGDPRTLRMAQDTGYCGGSVFKKLFRGVID